MYASMARRSAERSIGPHDVKCRRGEPHRSVAGTVRPPNNLGHLIRARKPNTVFCDWGLLPRLRWSQFHLRTTASRKRDVMQVRSRWDHNDTRREAV
jgi:hypothetical protein